MKTIHALADVCNVGRAVRARCAAAGSRLARASGALIALLAAGTAHAVNDLPGGPAVNQIDLHPAASQIAADQVWLHNFMMVLCTVIFILVFGAMFYSILKHRKSKGYKAANFHESTTVEIAWTVVPFIIVIFMALPATKVVVAMKDTTNADLTIKATGMQWKWGYDYINGPGAGISFISTLDPEQRLMSDSGHPAPVDDYLLKVDHPLVVPVDKKVRIITTAVDVIHAFAVNSLGIKQDAIPGFVRDTWFRATKVGDYYGQCQELCGKEHAYMPIHVKVLSQEDYAVWVQSKTKSAQADDTNKTWTQADLMAHGEKVFTTNCVVCHGAHGEGGVGKKLDGSPIVQDADKSKQIAVVLHGAGNGMMPSWAALSDADLASVITFTKNSWSNKTGQVVQPADVAVARK